MKRTLKYLLLFLFVSCCVPVETVVPVHLTVQPPNIKLNLDSAQAVTKINFEMSYKKDSVKTIKSISAKLDTSFGNVKSLSLGYKYQSNPFQSYFHDLDAVVTPETLRVTEYVKVESQCPPPSFTENYFWELALGFICVGFLIGVKIK